MTLTYVQMTGALRPDGNPAVAGLTDSTFGLTNPDVHSTVDVGPVPCVGHTNGGLASGRLTYRTPNR